MLLEFNLAGCVPIVLLEKGIDHKIRRPVPIVPAPIDTNQHWKTSIGVGLGNDFSLKDEGAGEHGAPQLTSLESAQTTDQGLAAALTCFQKKRTQRNRTQT